MRTFSTANFNITIFNERVFVYEQNYITITQNSTPPALTVTVDGRVYKFHTNSITIEYSDIIASAAANTGNVVVDGLSIPWKRFFGVRPDANIILPPNRLIIPDNVPGISLAFYLPIFYETAAVVVRGFTRGVATLLTTIAANTLSNYSLPTIGNYDYLGLYLGHTNLKKYFLERINRYNIDTYGSNDYYYINIESGDCGTNYLLVHWLGRNGLMKSYVFEVESAKRGAANVVELFDSTLRDTVTYRKKMNVSLNLIARDISGCDAEYLSDIVTSNDVQAVCDNWGALPVGVTNSNANYGQSRGDFKITIETKKYY
jgi:hypothetical protein